MLNIPTNFPQHRFAIEKSKNQHANEFTKEFRRTHRAAVDVKNIVDLRSHSHFSAIPAPPMSVAEYVSSHSPSVRLASYLDQLRKTLRNTSLDKYQSLRTPENFVGKGAFKVCHDIGNGKVLVAGDSAAELMRLAMLERAGVPVAKVHEFGSIQMTGFREQAYVQQKLEDFYVFGQNQPETMHSDFLKSPLLNEKTVASLKAIQTFMQKYYISDLQGGLAADGTFRLTDILDIHKAESNPTPFALKQAQRLNHLIRSTETELQHRRSGGLRNAA